MKVHYINILLFAIPLNILVNAHKKKPYITPKIPPTRLLCECELYEPANYDNDQEMKEVMENYNRQTSDRFKEYDERMKTTRQKCKEQCDKEIQKIILKDKLEKELTEKFATLQTDIQSDSIPTCICEKSIADKMEKGCLRCGGVLGGGIAPTFGLIGSVAINMWKTTEIAAATKAAIAVGETAGKIAGDIEGAAKVVELVKSIFKIEESSVRTLESIIDANTYTKSSLISKFIQTEYSRLGCGDFIFSPGPKKPICNFVNKGIVTTTRVGTGGSPEDFIKTTVEAMVSKAEGIAETEAAKVAAAKTATIKAAQEKAIEAASTELYTTIAYSITAILIIVLIMVIIYLILRYRRKKKMKKKLQYIKLLKE